MTSAATKTIAAKRKVSNMTNRLTSVVAEAEALIASHMERGVDLKGKPIEESLASLDETMGVSDSEHSKFQGIQSRAFANGLLHIDEAQMVYAALGESRGTSNGGWQPGVTLAMKMTITQLMEELLRKQAKLDKRMKQKGR